MVEVARVVEIDVDADELVDARDPVDDDVEVLV
jgi:hypothetical protein